MTNIQKNSIFKNAILILIFCVFVAIIFTISKTVSEKSVSEYNLSLIAKIDSLEQTIIKIESQVNYIDNIMTAIDSTKFDKDWFLFKWALMQVESELNPNAVNEYTLAGGLYQHMPISRNGFLREANRVQNEIEFTDTCRFDPLRATMIFEIVNFYRNPNKDINRAIWLHNPTAGNWYKERVLKKYEFAQLVAYQL